MSLDELFTYLEFGIKKDKDFGLIDYYAFTNDKPNRLIGVAYKAGRKGIAGTLQGFYLKHYGGCIMMSQERIKECKFGIGERILSNEEINDIYNFLVNENYPITNGLFFEACKKYMLGNGFEALRKENVRNKLITKYNEKENNVKQKKLVL